ncbi:AAA family ATPase [Candidatus Woesebacteria bacterium]|nr:AAA family ATPase [Candidatus Woesebacteria bacterium]
MKKNDISENIKSYKPFVLVLCGPPLSRKTTLGDILSAQSNLTLFDVDITRWELFPKTGLLEPDPETNQMVTAYQTICRRASETLQNGTPALLTGTFSRAEFKQPLEELYGKLQEQGIEIRIFQLTADEEEIKRRIDSRRASGVHHTIDTIEKYRWAHKSYTSITFAEPSILDTQAPLDQLSQNIFDSLESLTTSTPQDP